MSEIARRDAPPGASYRALLPAVLLLALCCLSGCGAAGPQNSGGPDEAAADGTAPVRVDLGPVDGSGATGTVAFVPGAGGGSEVRLSLQDVPDPGSVYVGAVYNGRCPQGVSQGASWGAFPGDDVRYRFVHGDDEDSADEENVVQTLVSIEANPAGRGASTTPLPVSVAEMLSGDAKYVDVHGEGGEAVACADLPTDRAPRA